MEQPKPKKRMQEFYLPSSLLQDPTQEPLQIILTPYKGIKEVPAELGSGDVASFVFKELTNCFQKAGFVAEGMLANIIWGFQECGFSPNYVAGGLTKLRHLGYISYSDIRRVPIHETNFDPKKPIWIRYEKKFTNLFIRDLITP